MYKIAVSSIYSNGDGYYTVRAPFIRINNENYDLGINFNIKVISMDLETNHSLDVDNPLEVINNSNYVFNENQVVIVKSENVALQFFSQDLETFIDTEVRGKFPNEDVSVIKQEFIKDVCELVDQRGID